MNRPYIRYIYSYRTVRYCQNLYYRSKGKHGPNRTNTVDRILPFYREKGGPGFKFRSNCVFCFLPRLLMCAFPLQHCISDLHWRFVKHNIRTVKYCENMSQNGPLGQIYLAIPQPFAPYHFYRVYGPQPLGYCYALYQRTAPYNRTLYRVPYWHKTDIDPVLK